MAGNPDPHFRSGVLNKWFYLLSDGGIGTNNIGNAYNVAGITIEKAANIAYMTEQNLFSNDGYAQARLISIQVTQNFYGVGSCEEIAVRNAWYAVGVGPVIPNQVAAVITGANEFCSTSNYTVTGLQNASIVTWASSNTSIATVNNQGVVTQISNGEIDLIATITTTICGNVTTTTITKRVNVGTINNIDIIELSRDCNEIIVSANAPSGIPLTWTADANTLIDYNYSPVTTSINPVTIRPTWQTSCDYINVSYTAGGCTYKSNNGFNYCLNSIWSNGSVIWHWGSPLPGEPLIVEVTEGMPDAAYYKWYVNGIFLENTDYPYLNTRNWPCVFDGPGVSCFAVLNNGCEVERNIGNYSPLCYNYKNGTSNIKIYPNPAYNQAIIKLDIIDKANKTNLKEIKQIKIIDKMGNLKLLVNNNLKNNQIIVDVSKLANDVYFVVITDGITEYRLPLIVKH